METRKSLIEEEESSHEKTKEKEKIILEIEELLQKEENVLSEFCKSFQALSKEMLKELESSTDVSDKVILGCSDLKDKIVEELSFLKKIYMFSEKEKNREEQRVSKEISVSKDLKTEVSLLRKFDVDSDLRVLAKEVVKKLNSELKLAKEDIDTDKRVTKEIKEYMELLFSIKDILEKIVRRELKDGELRDKLQELDKKIEEQLDKLKELADIEKLHLHVLLKLYIDELSTINLEKKLKKEEDKIGIGDMSQDETVLLDE
jgi:hypothetical protein